MFCHENTYLFFLSARMFVEIYYNERSLLVLDHLLLPMLLNAVNLKDLPTVFPFVPTHLSAALILSKLPSSEYNKLSPTQVCKPQLGQHAVTVT